MSRRGRLGARAGDAYDRSRAGRRLAGRLHRAMIDTTPARWRLGQVMVAGPLALLTIAVFGAGAGLVIAAGAVRTGGRLALRARAGRRANALERGAAVLARCLGAELAAGACAEDALAAAAASLPATDRPLRAVAGAALVRSTLGEAPGAALGAAAAESGGEARGLAAVAALLALHGGAGGDPGSFDRLAEALDAAIATRDDARALTAEPRLVAAAVPALAGVLGITLVLTEPAIAAGVTAPLPAGVLGGCAAVALGGTVVARRLAAVG
ncbi:MAG TPA: hypothetical protein VGL20_13410 [Candidatus Dormibacteraeota bacterium]|jgi:hypothetical protein